MGRITRALNIRLNEHIANIRKGYKNHSVSRHYDLMQGRDPAGTLFMGIVSFTSHWRGSLKVRELSKIETKCEIGVWLGNPQKTQHLVPINW